MAETTNWNGNIIIDSSTGIGYNSGCNSGSDTISIGNYSRLYNFEDCESCNDSIVLTFPSSNNTYTIANPNSELYRTNLRLKVINGCNHCVVARTSAGAVFKSSQTLPASSEILYKTFNTTIDNLFTSCDCVTAEIGTNYKSIGENAFKQCSTLREVDCSDVRTIGNNAFYNCNRLTTFNAKGYCPTNSPSGFNGIMSIGEYSFGSCSSLTSLSSNTINSIGANAFTSSGLTSIDLKNIGSIITINQSAFSGLSDLLTVEIECRKINFESGNSSLFTGCVNLSSIKLDVSEFSLPAAVGSFIPDLSLIILYVPLNLINDYLNSQVWGGFNIQPIPNS